MTDLDKLLTRVKALEAAVEEQKVKSWIEVAAIPLAIALTGVGSTWFVTRTQTSSAETLAKNNLDNTKQISDSTLEVTRRTAESQQALKALELCIRHITDPNPKTRERGVKLLTVIAPELAVKIREALLSQEKDQAVIRAVTEVQIFGWFPVVASIHERPSAVKRAEEINRSGSSPYLAEVYEGAMDANGVPVFAITLGGFLSEAEAISRVTSAKSLGIAKDAYPQRNKNTWEKIY
jgi:hypothetical protein